MLGWWKSVVEVETHWALITAGHEDDLKLRSQPPNLFDPVFSPFLATIYYKSCLTRICCNTKYHKSQAAHRGE